MEAITLSEVKRMDIKEFREMGLLAELNRSFLHPLGLALETNIRYPWWGEILIKLKLGKRFKNVIKKRSKETLGGIWDYRSDPEGMLFSKEHFPAEKIKKAQEFIKQKHEQRMRILGFVYQDPDNP